MNFFANYSRLRFYTAFSINQNIVKAVFVCACIFVTSSLFCQRLPNHCTAVLATCFIRTNHWVSNHLSNDVISNGQSHISENYLDSPANPTHFTDTSDRDKDGIVDSLDKCPDEKGVIQYDGCPVPDSDNDGIADDSDECPTIPGLVKNRGCPPGDRDGDKIIDDVDECPDQPGVARFNGCLIKDTDGDGINDDADKCKTIPGTSANFGCPENKLKLSGKGNKKKKKDPDTN